MNDVLTDLSATALAAAIKSNLCEFFRSFQQSAAADFFEGSNLIRWRTPVLHPWFNGVVSIQPPASDAAQEIEETLAYFESHHVPGITWWLGPHLQTTAWDGLLLTHGLQFMSGSPGMAVTLAQLEPMPLPTGLSIRRVENLEMLKEWTHIFVAGYGLPAAWESSLFDLVAGMGFDRGWLNSLGYWHGKPVATSSLFLGAGVAGIYNVATIVEARGQGIGAALTLDPLLEARRLGYRAGVLQSSEMGFGIYRRLGFQKLCDMDYYNWTNHENAPRSSESHTF